MAKEKHLGSTTSDSPNGVAQNRDFVQPPAGQSDPDHLKRGRKIIKSVREKWQKKIQGTESRTTPKSFTD